LFFRERDRRVRLFGREVDLSFVGFELLRFLAERHPEVVSKRGHDTKVASASGSSEQIRKICPFSRPPISLSALASSSRALADIPRAVRKILNFRLFLLPDTQSTFVS
jgi:hypothetical protein